MNRFASQNVIISHDQNSHNASSLGILSWRCTPSTGIKSSFSYDVEPPPLKPKHRSTTRVIFSCCNSMQMSWKTSVFSLLQKLLELR